MVAGASRGLGFAVARALAREGAKISLSSRSPEAALAAAETIRTETGADVFAVAADVRSADALANWHHETVERFGGIDLLYINCGGPPPGPVLKFDDAAWQGAFELLLLSAVRMIRLAVPSMTARGGRRGSLLPTSSAVKEPIGNIAQHHRNANICLCIVQDSRIWSSRRTRFVSKSAYPRANFHRSRKRVR